MEKRTGFNKKGMTFAVERTIDGVRFLKYEDYIEAESRDEADLNYLKYI